MDIIQRIAILLLLAIPALMPNTAKADYPSTPIWKTDTGTVFYGSTAHEALDKYVTRFSTCSGNTQYISGVIQKLETTYRVNWLLCSNNSQYNTAYIDASKLDDCGAGRYESPYNGTCTGSPPPPTCTPPLVLNTVKNTCEDPCSSKTGQPESYFSNTPGAGDSCVGGCTVQMDSGDCGKNTAGQTGCFYEGSYTGSSCSGTESGTGSTPQPQGDSPEYDCIKQGKQWGTVNGTVVCVGAGTPGASPTTSYSPGTSSSSTTTSSNSSGSTTSSTQSTGSSSSTFNSDGTVTTTKTGSTTGSDGTQSTTQTSTTQPVADFCRDNPNVEQCKAADKGTFSGSCADGVAQVQCEGDAIACAIARQSAEANCKFFKDDADLTNKYNEAKNDNGSNSPAHSSKVQTVNVPTSLDASSPYAGQCNQDVTISVAGSTVTIPFSAWCDVLNALGYLFLACAYISAAIILGSAV